MHPRIGFEMHSLLVVVTVFAVTCLGVDASRAAGDPVQGKAAFTRQCAICHTVEKGGPNRFGPNLFGILGRKAGTVGGFIYSRAFKATANWDWNEDLVAGWIGAPGVWCPAPRWESSRAWRSAIATISSPTWQRSSRRAGQGRCHCRA